MVFLDITSLHNTRARRKPWYAWLSSVKRACHLARVLLAWLIHQLYSVKFMSLILVFKFDFFLV